MVLQHVLSHYESQKPVIDYTDGVSLEFPEWRFNLRASNTEPLLRLNVESRGDDALLQHKTGEVIGLIETDS